jgi:hypothetical protein
VATDRAVDTSALRQQLLRWIGEDAGLRNGEHVTNAVIIFSTERLGDDGKVEYDDGRVYPLGETSPTAEYGLVGKAWDDIRGGE